MTGIDLRGRHLQAKRLLHVLAAGTAVAAALAIIFLPSYVIESETSSGGRSVDSATALDVVGPWLLVVLAIPVGISLVPAVWRGNRWQLLSVASAVLLVVFALVGSLSIGWYFYPAAVLSIIAACVPARRRA